MLRDLKRNFLPLSCSNWILLINYEQPPCDLFDIFFFAIQVFFSYIKCRNFAPLMEIYEKSVGIPLSLAQFLSKHLQTNLIVRKNVDARRENKFMMCLRNLMNLEEIRGNSWTGTSIFKPSKLNDSKKLGVKTVFRLIHLVLTISKWYLVLSGKILILINKLMLLMITIC